MNSSLAFLPLDLAICGAMLLLGAIFVRSVLGRTDTLAYLSLGLCVGGGLLSFSMFIASWAGIPLTAGSVVALYVGLALLATSLAFRGSRAELGAGIGRAAGIHSRLSWLTASPWLLTVLLAAAAFVISVGLS
ncbi:MAG: hypothetical protein HGB17_16065 [Syntrophobacteraceae bacterium]|nr:hypothetical protein [Syntrophobacteraceae bacterium]